MLMTLIPLYELRCLWNVSLEASANFHQYHALKGEWKTSRRSEDWIGLGSPLTLGSEVMRDYDFGQSP
jgi:hypothetical protein